MPAVADSTVRFFLFVTGLGVCKPGQKSRVKLFLAEIAQGRHGGLRTKLAAGMSESWSFARPQARKS